jgi:hypothetical protein
VHELETVQLRGDKIGAVKMGKCGHMVWDKYDNIVNCQQRYNVNTSIGEYFIDTCE